MKDVKPFLLKAGFPKLHRNRLVTLQLNLGYLCNLSCTHCHVNAGPNRTELMSKETMQTALAFANKHGIQTLDLTGGSPEMNPEFYWLVQSAKAMGLHVIDRCNPTILVEQGYEWVAGFLAEQQAEVIASLPCYLEKNVDAQRGKGAFTASIAGLRLLNELGYGDEDGNLKLNLVFNPQGPYLPPPQEQLEADYRRFLGDEYGIRFNRLFALANMPIQRFGAVLFAQDKNGRSKSGGFDAYLDMLKGAFQEAHLANVMCKSLISVDWEGFIYDCDFNQMLGLPLSGGVKKHIGDVVHMDFQDAEINVAEHCYGCTAGQGSSCGGALS